MWCKNKSTQNCFSTYSCVWNNWLLFETNNHVFFYDFVYLLLKLVLILPAVTAVSVESVFSALSLVKTS